MVHIRQESHSSPADKPSKDKRVIARSDGLQEATSHKHTRTDKQGSPPAQDIADAARSN